ncbi:MAG: tRNA guanosine(34) transglycosylase Tgt, partial [Candidatus Kapaibacterium sp.]
MSQEFFKLIHTSDGGEARAGELHTDHGIIKTPVFMPVGTVGTVKAISHKTLLERNAGIILGNTYHLYLRPGMEVMSHFGGLHKFMNWPRAILTDSGGYQIFSLQELRKISEEGAEFKSHIDGSMHFFSPEAVVDIQRNMGSDIMMVLDECVPYPAEYDYVRNSMELSLRWAARAKTRLELTETLYGHRQFLFGIGQGGMYENLR